MKLPNNQIGLSVCVLVIAIGQWCWGDTFISAPTQSPRETNSLFPLLVKQAGFTNPPTMRYQQVYRSTLFTNLDSDYVKKLSFKFEFLGTNPPLISWTVPKMQINLSTTLKSPDSLSPVFSQNVGSDDMIVFGPSGNSFQASVSGEDLEIDLGRSFKYNPAVGNLLIDIRIYDGSGSIDTPGPALKAFDSPNDEISRVWSTNVNASVADGMDTVGLTTSIWFSPDSFFSVPLPKGDETLSWLPFLIKQTYNSAFGNTNYPVSIRYQQVYSSNIFSSLDPSLAYLTALTFLLESPSHPNIGLGWTVKNMQINLSTTSRGPGDLSKTFADNIGEDETVVFGPGTNTFYAITPDGPLVVYPDPPFRYNPNRGNLLVDVRLSDETGPSLYDMFGPILEAFSSPTGLVSRVWSTNMTSLMADSADNIGLTTMFQFDGIPSVTSKLLPFECDGCPSNLVRITWPSQPSIFKLQHADQFGTGIIWQAATNQVFGSPSYGGWFIDVPTGSSSPQGFYRLIWPGGK